VAGVAGATAAPTAAPRRATAGVDWRRMTLVASFSTAVATWSAGAAHWLPAGESPFALVVLGVALALAVGAVVIRRVLWTLPAGKDVLLLTGVTTAGLLFTYVAGWANREHLGQVAQYLPVIVAVLAGFWPQPNVLRYCVLLAGGTLLGAPQPSRPALVVALVAMAVALVATSRLAASAAPRLGGAPAVRGRRLAGEAAAVLVVVGLLAALAASLLPPPAGGGGGLGDLLAQGRGRLPAPPAPAIDFDDRLDVGGGRGKPGDEYVLLVRAQEADVWRAVTYDRWNGESWSRSPERSPIEEDDPVEPGIGDRPSDPEAGFGPSDLYQRVTILALTAHVLVAAPVPRYASALGGVEQGADASLYPSEPLTRGEAYVVVSDRTAASTAELRALGDTPAAVVPAGVAQAYLQLPPLSPRVRQLATELGAGEPTTFDKARAVERWIDRNTTVTDEAAPVPAGADALETFLLEERAGPPERAATAMAVMLRAIGVPARLAVGFLPGRRSAPDEPFAVRLSDTHAWVEVWFPTVGWQRFDPTGRAPDPRAEADSVWDRLLRFLKKLWPLLVLLIVAGAGWAAWRVAAWRRRRAALPWSTRYFARVERAGRARGRPRRPEETPREYTRGLAASVLPDPRLEEVGELVTVAAWSRHEPAIEDKARADAVLKAARKASPVPLRRRRRRPRPTIAKP
jgi:transglutaminase-like putative cysteine protease